MITVPLLIYGFKVAFPGPNCYLPRKTGVKIKERERKKQERMQEKRDAKRQIMC